MEGVRASHGIARRVPHGAAATVAILALPVRNRIGVRARGGKSQLAIFWFHFVWLDLLPSPSPPKIARICMHDPRVRDSCVHSSVLDRQFAMSIHRLEHADSSSAGAR